MTARTGYFTAFFAVIAVKSSLIEELPQIKSEFTENILKKQRNHRIIKEKTLTA